MKLPPDNHDFWFWIFDCCCDSGFGNFGAANDNREYGISCEDFVRDYPEAALEDAHKYFERNCSTESEKRAMLMRYIKDQENEMKRIEANILAVEEL